MDGRTRPKPFLRAACRTLRSRCYDVPPDGVAANNPIGRIGDAAMLLLESLHVTDEPIRADGRNLPALQLLLPSPAALENTMERT